MIQANPLDSTAALNLQKKQSKNLEESPIVKSLFDFPENSKFKKSETESFKSE